MQRTSTLLAGAFLGLFAAGVPAADTPSRALLDLGFVERPAPGVRFAGRFGGVRAWLTDDAVHLEGRSEQGGAAVRLVFEGRSPDSRLEAEGERPTRVHLLRGADPGAWRVGLRTFDAAIYRGLRPGVDLVLHRREGRLAYDLALEPGADLSRLVVRVEGSDGLDLRPDGELVIHTAAGDFVQAAPRSFAVSDGGIGRPVESRFVLLDEHRFGFEAAALAPGEELLVDPSIAFATYLGGSSFDRIDAVVRDDDGTLVVAGQTLSFDFPTTPGAFDTTFGGSGVGADDAFVARLSADGQTVLFATFLGGTDGETFLGEFACDVAIDPANGDIVVVGTTSATDFPTTAGALQTARSGTRDAFVTRLAAAGDALVSSTYLGGKKTENAVAVALDAQGNAFVTGDTSSTDFPLTANAFDQTLDGPGVFDGFLAVLDPTAQTLLYGSYFGGTDDDYGADVAVNALGRAVLVGESASTDFPVNTSGSFGSQAAGGADAVALEVDVQQGNTNFALYLGGSTSDSGRAVTTDDLGNVYVVGRADSNDLPTTPGADEVFDGSSDAFLLVLTPGATGLVYGTYLGGSGTTGLPEEALAVTRDAMGRTLVVGRTNSTDFPTAGTAPDNVLDGPTDAFVARFAADFSQIDSATLLGGVGDDALSAVALVDQNDVVAVGSTSSADLPTTPGAAQETFGGGFTDGFVTRIGTDCAGGFQEFGSGCPDGTGQVPHLQGTGCPEVGASLTVTLSGAQPGAFALLLAGVSTGHGQVTQACVIDVFPFAVALPLLLDGTGGFSASFDVPPGFPPGVVHVQTLHADPGAPTGLSASNALSIGFLQQP